MSDNPKSQRWDGQSQSEPARCSVCFFSLCGDDSPGRIRRCIAAEAECSWRAGTTLQNRKQTADALKKNKKNKLCFVMTFSVVSCRVFAERPTGTASRRKVPLPVWFTRREEHIIVSFCCSLSSLIKLWLFLYFWWEWVLSSVITIKWIFEDYSHRFAPPSLFLRARADCLAADTRSKIADKFRRKFFCTWAFVTEACARV